MELQWYPTIVLATNCNESVLELRGIERCSDGSGFSAQMYVLCHGFSATRPFFFSERAYGSALAALRAMAESLEGEARLDEDYEQDQFLQLAVNSQGHVQVAGRLVQLDARTTALTFHFDTDQTCLRPLVRALEALNE